MTQDDNGTPGPPPPETGPGADAESATASGPAGELQEVTRQRDEYYDLLLRKTAEFDNYKRRVERERRELGDYTVGEFAKELLPVIDDFARALDQAGAATDPFAQGVQLIYRRLLDVLTKRGVVVLDPTGEPFDPHLHEAVARVPAEGRQDGEIVEVFSRGYKLGDRLLRPAMVKVATA